MGWVHEDVAHVGLLDELREGRALQVCARLPRCEAGRLQSQCRSQVLRVVGHREVALLHLVRLQSVKVLTYHLLAVPGQVTLLELLDPGVLVELVQPQRHVRLLWRDGRSRVTNRPRHLALPPPALAALRPLLLGPLHPLVLRVDFQVVQERPLLLVVVHARLQGRLGPHPDVRHEIVVRVVGLQDRFVFLLRSSVLLLSDVDFDRDRREVLVLVRLVAPLLVVGRVVVVWEVLQLLQKVAVLLVLVDDLKHLRLLSQPLLGTQGPALVGWASLAPALYLRPAPS